MTELAPEAQLLILNGAILVVAYLGIYPSLETKTLNRVMTIDMILSAIAFGVAGALFWGSGIRFNMLFFNTNWAAFSIITLMIMEVPLFLYFAQKHGIDLTGGEDP
jgi:hypothetical protein